MMRTKIALSMLVATTVAAGMAAVPSTASAQQRATKPAKAKFGVSIKANRAELVLGEKVVLRGRVTPARRAAGQLATLQQRIVGSKKWKPQGTDKIDKKGRYRLTDEPSSVQARQYRVVVPAVGRVGKGHSKKVLVTVYRWQDLASVQVRNSAYFLTDTGAEIDTVPYARSLVGATYGHTGFVDYNLARQCIQLKARYGLGDDSDENASALIEVSGDGTTLYSKSFALTESASKALSLRGVFRLKFSFVASNPDDTDTEFPDGAQAVVARPKVLCSF